MDLLVAGVDMRKIITFVVFSAALMLFAGAAMADVRIKQKVTMSGQSMETTRSIKGSRERTETRIEMADPQAAAFMPQIANITQCDLKRTVRLNDRKRLYLLEPFATSAADIGPVTRTTPERPTTTTTRRGGTVTMISTVKDTGERKMMFGLQARHLIITQEMESSADSCSGPNKMKMEFDGWYVDFSAEFNCPMATPEVPATGGYSRPDCADRVIMRGNAAARTGFLLQGTMRMYGKDGTVQLTSTTETLELSRAPLEASLFDVPAGYQLASSQQDLYAVSMPSMGNVDRENPRANVNRDRPSSSVNRDRPAAKSVAVNVTYGSISPAARAEIDQYLKNRVSARGYRTATGTGDYVLNIEVRQVKESAAGKVGGIFGKVTGIETKVGKVDIDMSAELSGGATGQAKVKSKFDGPPSDAIRTALDQLLDQAFRDLRN